MISLAVRRGRLLDGRLVDVDVDAGRIVRIDDHAARTVGRGTGATVVLDLEGMTLLPGLIDAHAHLGIVSDKVDPEVPVAAVAAEIFANCRAALDEGFTTIRDMGGIDGGVVQAIRAGLVPGPRILPSGPIICQTGGNGDVQSPWVEPRRASYGVPGLSTLASVCDGPDGVRRAARLALRRGATQVKVSATGLDEPRHVSETSSLEFTVAELRAAVETAAAHGTYVSAHCLNAEGLRRSLEAGVGCIEHGGVDSVELAREMQSRGVPLVPTLTHGWRSVHGDTAPTSTTIAGDWARAMRESLEIARAGGVAIGLGSDREGAGQQRRGLELVLRSLLGSPAETIASATSVNASILRRPDLGAVAVGARADLIAVDGDPCREPDLWLDRGRVCVVVQDGRVHRSELGQESAS